jgi:RNA polymerase-interacting CarD/CdnL/TRCF family regulator
MTSLPPKAKIKRRKKKQPDEILTNDKPLKPVDSNEQAIKNATELWNDIKQRIKRTPEFINMSDSEKINIYQKSKFKEFYTSYPIVCRYMICMGQFSVKAFNRFLKKCETMNTFPQKRGSEASEEQWIMRQADYVRYLWESYQKQHFSTVESQNIWKHAYDTLKQEFKEFKDMHKKVEDKLKTDEKFNKAELVKELVNRIANEEQSLSENSTQHLLHNLKVKVLQQRRRNLAEQIKKDVPRVMPSFINRGLVKEPN